MSYVCEQCDRRADDHVPHPDGAGWFCSDAEACDGRYRAGKRVVAQAQEQQTAKDGGAS